MTQKYEDEIILLTGWSRNFFIALKYSRKWIMETWIMETFSDDVICYLVKTWLFENFFWSKLDYGNFFQKLDEKSVLFLTKTLNFILLCLK